MPVKSPNPFKLLNPSDHNTVRLQYAQQLQLMLPDPTEFKYPEGSTWEVRAEGNFLKKTLKGLVHRKDGPHDLYIYSQVHTQNFWPDLSHVLLGNIYVSIKTPDADQPIRRSCVCVFLDCDRPSRDDVVTVIDPSPKERPFVKLEPRQILEVVVTDTDALERLEWRGYPLPLQLGQQYLLEQLHYEFLPIGETTGSVSLGADKPYYCERRVYDEKGGIVSLGEHHFFYGFKYLTSEDLMKLDNGCYPASVITLIGKGSNKQKVKDQRVAVGLTLRKSVRRRELHLKNNPKESLQIINPREKLEDIPGRRLVNPGKTEQIQIYGEGDTFTIDIVSPNIYFPHASEVKKTTWRSQVLPMHLNTTHMHCVKVDAQSNKYINDNTFQRFDITLENPPVVNGERMLAKVVLSCDELKKVVLDNNIVLYIMYKAGSIDDDPTIISRFRQVQVGNSTYRVQKRDLVTTGHQTTQQQVYNQGRTKHHHRNSRFHKPKFEDELKYFEVEIIDQGNDLVSGERVEYINSYQPGVSMIAYEEPDDDPDSDYYGMSYIERQTRIALSRKDTDWEDEQAKKKRNGAKGPYGSNSTGIGSVNGTKWRGNLIGNEVDTKENERKTGITIPDVEPPHELYWPSDRQLVTLSRGEPLEVYLLLPKGNFKASGLRRQWAPNVVNVIQENGFRLWIDYSQVKESEDAGLIGFPYQKIRVLPLTPRDAKPGNYRIGSLRLDDGDGHVKIVNVDLNIGDTERKDARYWRNYYFTLIQSRFIDFGKVAEVKPSYVENRTTLVDPIQETVDIPIDDWHEIEIILTPPAYQNDAKIGWEVKANMMKGEIVRLDSGEYQLFDGSTVHRSLYRVDRKDDQALYGEIKISWDGVDTKTRIRPYFAENTRKSKLDSNSTVRVVGDVVDGTKVRFEDWKHEEHITIFPTDNVSIQVPETVNLLSPGLRLSARWSPWRVELEEFILNDEIWSNLDEDAQAFVDQDAPYYEDVGMFSSGTTPWDNKEFVLPSLLSVQPYVYDIIDAMREYYGTQASYPLAVLTFEHPIKGEFVIKRTVYLDLGDPEYVHQNPPIKSSSFDNPPDNDKIELVDEQLVAISLPYKFKGGERVQWRCSEVPNWMLRLDYQDDPCGEREIYNFRTELPLGTHKNTGKLCFDCEDGYLRKRLTVICLSQVSIR